MCFDIVKTFLAWRDIPSLGKPMLSNSKGPSWDHAFGMQSNQFRALSPLWGLCTPGGNIPLLSHLRARC